jgi:hypothetical protein
VQNAFQEKDEGMVRNTIQRLPLNVVIPLTKEVCQRLQGHPTRYTLLFFIKVESVIMRHQPGTVESVLTVTCML